MIRPAYLMGLLVFVLLSSACQQADYKRRNAILISRLDSLEGELQMLRTMNASLLEEAGGDEIQVGFEVQIGAFEEFDLGAYTEDLVKLRGIKSDQMTKYVLGRFHQYEDAIDFLNDVRKMGLNDAFIAGIVGGERRTIDEAKAAVADYYGDSDF